jgi:hypothetical protein
VYGKRSCVRNQKNRCATRPLGMANSGRNTKKPRGGFSRERRCRTVKPAPQSTQRKRSRPENPTEDACLAHPKPTPVGIYVFRVLSNVPDYLTETIKKGENYRIPILMTRVKDHSTEQPIGLPKHGSFFPLVGRTRQTRIVRFPVRDSWRSGPVPPPNMASVDRSPDRPSFAGFGLVPICLGCTDDRPSHVSTVTVSHCVSISHCLSHPQSYSKHSSPS